MRFYCFFLGVMLCASQLFSCTGIFVQAKDGSTVSGRTVEFGRDLDMSLAVIPRNTTFIGKTPMGNGMRYQAKYAVVGVFCFDEVVLMDGMNEKGLVAGSFYFPGYASYSKVTKENQSRALSPVDFPNWILTQFATLDEVKKALKTVVIAPTIFKDWGGAPPPMHYIVYDRFGKSLVIEPVDGVLKVYDNDLGVITNSPTFDWHMTNLNNYINLTPYNMGSHKLENFTLNPFGQGSGMLGLPGDFTPPSRFVRAAFFSVAATLSKNSDKSVDQAFHILNQFDIPLGFVREKERKKIAYDYTSLTTVKNPENLQYFYRSYDNQEIQFVDLNKFDPNAKNIKTMKILGKQKKYDVSSMLK